MPYIPKTRFEEKDRLDRNDANKIIYGSEFAVEFDAISNAFVEVETSLDEIKEDLENGTGGGDSYDDTQIKADLAKETQDRTSGDAALELRIDAVEDSIGGGGDFVDAPNDGKLYGRQSQNWEEVPSGGVSDWADIENKPTEFPPSNHTHEIAEVNGLQDALDNAGGGSDYAVSIADTPPANGKSGDTWFDSTEGEGALYIHDGDVWFSSNTFGQGSSGGSGGSVEAIASGALATGEAVIVNADGTVSGAIETVEAGEDIAEGLANISVMLPEGSNEITASYDPSTDSFLVAYKDGSLGGSYYGFVLVAKISGNDVTYGTPVVFNSGGSTQYISITYDPNTGNHVIAYNDYNNANKGRAIVATVLQDTVTLGTAVTFEDKKAEFISSAYDSKNGKHVITYEDQLSSGHGKAIVGTVAGNTIQFGPTPTFSVGNCRETSVVYDPVNEKLVVSYRVSSPNQSFSIVGEISEDKVVFNGAESLFQTNGAHIRSVYDHSSGRVVIAFQSGPDNNLGAVVTGVISGDSFVHDERIVFSSTMSSMIDACYDPAAEKVIITHLDGNPAKVIACSTDADGNVSFDTAVEIRSTQAQVTSVCYSPIAGRSLVIAGRAGTSGTTHTIEATHYSPGGKFPDILSTNLTDTNYIGTASADYADGEAATIQTVGSVSEDQSGLTAGLAYYVQPDGSLGTSGDVFAGTAISPTKLIVKG